MKSAFLDGLMRGKAESLPRAFIACIIRKPKGPDPACSRPLTGVVSQCVGVEMRPDPETDGPACTKVGYGRGK